MVTRASAGSLLMSLKRETVFAGWEREWSDLQTKVEAVPACWQMRSKTE